MSDRNLGYFVLVFLLLLFLIPAVSISTRILKPLHKAVITFPVANTLNFLRKDDPVKVKGVFVGIVHRIYWQNGKTYVEIATRKKLDLHQGYRIIADAKGFMGDRYLEIDPGAASLPAIGPGEELIGRFPPGPVEALAYAESMKGKIRNLLATVEKLKTGSARHPPLAQSFRDKARSLDTVSMNLQLMLQRADTTISYRLDTLSAFLGKAGAVSGHLDRSLCLAESTMEIIEENSRGVSQKADSILASLNGKLQWMRGPEYEALTRQIDSVKTRIKALSRLAEELRQKGIKAKL